jgi:hypothetical protein
LLALLGAHLILHASGAKVEDARCKSKDYEDTFKFQLNLQAKILQINIFISGRID